MLRSLVPFLVMTACAWGEEKSAAVWTEELVATHQSVNGYLATYHTEGKNKHADITVALDRTSGLFAVEMKGFKDGKAAEFKQWNTDDDELYSLPGDLRLCCKGLVAEMRSLAELGKIMAIAPGQEHVTDYQFSPGVVLTDRALVPGIELTTRGAPQWVKLVEDATVKTSDADLVTFDTKDSGEVTVSRKSGLMTRQALGEKDGSARILELKEARMNPGRKGIEALSGKWDKTGAKPMLPGEITAGTRFSLFQQVIRAIEKGEGDLGKLETVLKEQGEVLRKFADGCISDHPDSLVNRDTWKKGLTEMRNLLKEKWEQRPKIPKEADIKDYETFLSLPDTRKTGRDIVVEILLSDSRSREVVMKEIFKARLQATNESGETARELLENAITRAYLEAIAERKIKAMWSEREGLD